MPDPTLLQPAFAIDDPALLKTDLTSCTLLLMAGSCQFNYAILDESNKKFIALKSYHYQLSHQWKTELEMLERFFDADPILYTAFNKVKLSVVSDKNVLVPGRIYHPHLKKSLLSFSHTLTLDELILTDEINELDIVNVFAADKYMTGFLRKEFSTDKIYHAGSALLKGIRPYMLGEDAPAQIFLFIQPQQFVIIVAKENQLQFYQTMYYQAAADVVYYLHNIVQQLQFSIDETKFYIGGDITADAKIFEELYKFLPQLNWVNRPAQFNYANAFQSFPSNYFFNLLAIALCG